MRDAILMPEERLALADLRREQTYRDARAKLDRHGRCAIIRPTGFGKTGLLTRFLRESKRTLYLYPTDIVRDAVLSFYHGRPAEPDDAIPGVEFMTYQKLVNLTADEMRGIGPFDMVATDECHKLGARETMRAMDMLLDAMPDVKLLGATATPERMDLVDEIGRYFGDHVTEPYTLHDAFQDGILLCPYYVWCGYGSVEENEAIIRRKMGREYELLDDEGKVVLEEHLAQRLIEISNLCNMENVIRRTCDKYAASTGYMRFVVFFSSFEAIHDRGPAVVEWFRAAYPGHDVRTLEISSETKATHDNVLELPKLQEAEDTIDLVLTCNMVNMGYHVPGLTGVVMYRGTKSSIVYGQQLGRVLSTGQDYRGIVFDVVDNLHEQAMYAVLGHESVFTAAARKRKDELLAKKREASLAADTDGAAPDAACAADGTRGGAVAGVQAQGADGATDAATGTVAEGAGRAGEATTWTRGDEMELRALERRLREGGGPRPCMNLVPEDLISVGFEATYKQLVAKIVAEPRSIRCRQAWARWCEQGGAPYDADGRLRTRAEILALVPPEDHPLPPYCKSKHVSVKAVLDEMLGGVEQEAAGHEADTAGAKAHAVTA